MKKTMLRLVTLVLALVMLAGTTVHAEVEPTYQTMPLTQILFENDSDMSEMYANPDYQAIFAASTVVDVLLFGNDVIDAETLLHMIENDHVYILKTTDNFYVVQIIGANGDFRVIYRPGEEDTLVNYDPSTAVADPQGTIEKIVTENDSFESYRNVPALDVLASMSAILETLQEGLE